jgi:DNA-binding GntR family transcriptional regulator
MLETTLAHTIAADLRQMIDRGAYAPGEAIRQDAVAKQFAVSRIPVREALRLLEQEGVVVIHANRGAFVVEHDQATVAELFDLRLMLESDLLRRACPRLTAGAIDRLRLVNRQASRTRDTHEWIKLDEEFHFTIYSAAGRSATSTTCCSTASRAVTRTARRPSSKRTSAQQSGCSSLRSMEPQDPHGRPAARSNNPLNLRRSHDRDHSSALVER